jgi:hypothetical protein
MLEIEINPRSPELFASVIGAERGKAFVDALAQAKQLLGGHTVWHVNSTATGGGVAEMLQSVSRTPRAPESMSADRALRRPRSTGLSRDGRRRGV